MTANTESLRWLSLEGDGAGAALAIRRGIVSALTAVVMFVGGCATLPPGMDAPKEASTALEHPESTALGKRFEAQAKEHSGLSGFRLLIDGTNAFMVRQEIAAKAERTLDVQYFLLQQDDTGKLLLQALLEAADRGVRVRLLLDDAEAFDVGSAIRPLAAHGNIEIRIFNPFVVRRELSVFRWAEFVVGGRRLNYRMHNKLFIGDNAIAVTGGRNVGDAYFQASSQIEFGDFDLAVVGPMVRAALEELRSLLERQACDPGRGAAARKAFGGRPRNRPEGARRAQGQDGGFQLYPVAAEA